MVRQRLRKCLLHNGPSGLQLLYLGLAGLQLNLQVSCILLGVDGSLLLLREALWGYTIDCDGAAQVALSMQALEQLRRHLDALTGPPPAWRDLATCQQRAGVLTSCTRSLWKSDWRMSASSGSPMLRRCIALYGNATPPCRLLSHFVTTPARGQSSCQEGCIGRGDGVLR